MGESGDAGQLMFVARADLSKIEQDIKDLQRKFDLHPINLKLKIDDATLREISNKVAATINSALRGLGAGGYQSGSSMPMLSGAAQYGISSALFGHSGVSIGHAPMAQLSGATAGTQITSNAAATNPPLATYSMAGKHCPRCGAMVDQNAQRCPSCGYDFVGRMTRISQGLGTAASPLTALGATAIRGGMLGFNVAKGALDAAKSMVDYTKAGTGITDRLFLKHFGQENKPRTLDDLYNLQEETSNWQWSLLNTANETLEGIGTSIKRLDIPGGGGGLSRRRKRKPRGPGGPGGGETTISQVAQAAAVHTMLPERETVSTSVQRLTDMHGLFGDFDPDWDHEESHIHGKHHRVHTPTEEIVQHPIKEVERAIQTERAIKAERGSHFNEAQMALEVAESRAAKAGFRGSRRRGGYVDFSGPVDAIAGMYNATTQIGAGFSQFGAGFGYAKQGNVVDPNFMGPPQDPGAMPTWAAGAGRWMGKNVPNAKIMGAAAAFGAVQIGGSYGTMQQQMRANVGGDPRANFNAQMQFADKVDSLGGGIPGMFDYATGDRRGHAMQTMSAGEQQNAWVEEGYAHRTSRKYVPGKILSMSDDYEDQKKALSFNTVADKSALADEYRKKREEAGRLQGDAQGRIEGDSGFDANSQHEIRQARVKTLAAEEVGRSKDLDDITAAGVARIERGHQARIGSAKYHTKATNLQGVDDYQSGLEEIKSGFYGAMRNSTSEEERQRLREQNSADVHAYQRQNDFANQTLARGVGVQVRQNYAGELGLKGNTIGAGIAGINAQREASNAELFTNMHGVNPLTNPGKALGLFQQWGAQQQGFDTQQKQMQKDYGLQLKGMEANNQSAQQLLGHDYLGAATTQIEAQRAYAKATMPSGQFTRANAGFNIQQRQANVNEEDRSLLAGLDTSRIETATAALNQTAKNQEMHASITSIKGNSEADIASIQASNLTPAEKKKRIDALAGQGQAQIANVQREIRHRQYGGTAFDLGGNFINFAQDSTRERDPQEDLADAQKQADAANKAMNNAAKNGQGAVDKREKDNKAIADANAAAMQGTPRQDAADAAAGSDSKEIVRLLQAIANMFPQVLAAQP